MSASTSSLPGASASFLSGPVTPGRFDERTLTSINLGGAVIPQPATRDRAVLVRMDETHAGQVTQTSSAGIRIGRHPTSSLVVDDEGISRSHARIFCMGYTFLIE
jgi:hypothetical protein